MILLLHEIVHVLAAIAIWVFSLKVGGLKLSLAWLLITSLLIDADHLVDYLLVIGSIFDPLAVINGTIDLFREKAFIPLHSWELAALLAILGIKIKNTKLKIPLLSISLGMIGHVLIDAAWYQLPIGFYSLLLRITHDFTNPLFW